MFFSRLGTFCDGGHIYLNAPLLRARHKLYLALTKSGQLGRWSCHKKSYVHYTAETKQCVGFGDMQIYIPMLQCPVLYCTRLQCPVLFRIMYAKVSCSVIYYFEVTCSVLNCKVLFCPKLYCPVLFQCQFVLYHPVVSCSVLY